MVPIHEIRDVRKLWIQKHHTQLNIVFKDHVLITRIFKVAQNTHWYFPFNFATALSSIYADVKKQRLQWSYYHSGPSHHNDTTKIELRQQLIKHRYSQRKMDHLQLKENVTETKQ